MVALALGEELERQRNDPEALRFYEEAERLFPLERFKELARERIRRLHAQIDLHGTGITPAEGSGVQAGQTLFIISCTKTKIWNENPDASKYVPAREAYRGKTLREWLESAEYRQAEHWVIFSAKYGFIEPDHPISNYDVTFLDDNTGALSLDSLRAQVEHQMFFKTCRRLRDFRRVEVWGSDLYFKIVCSAFMRAEAIVAHHKAFGG